MNLSDENNLIEKQPQKNQMQNSGEIFDAELMKMVKGEDKLFDLYKEHFSNVRTLITASAAIASVDLLALQALKDIGLENWFLTSVVLLYFSSIIYVFYLTYSNNVQAKQLVDRSGMVQTITNITKEMEAEKELNIIKFGDTINQNIKKAMSPALKIKRAGNMLTVGNALFVIGLFVPIIGFIKSLFT